MTPGGLSSILKCIMFHHLYSKVSVSAMSNVQFFSVCHPYSNIKVVIVLITFITCGLTVYQFLVKKKYISTVMLNNI